MAVTFYLRSPQQNEETSITIRIRWKKETLIRSTGFKIRPSEWNQRRQSVRKSSPYYYEMNAFLDKERILIGDSLISFVTKFGKHPTAAQFKAHLSRDNSKDVSNSHGENHPKTHLKQKHISMNTQKKYITRKEVRELFGISYPTILKYERHGLFGSYQLGNRILFKYEDIEQAMIERHRGEVRGWTRTPL